MKETVLPPEHPDKTVISPTLNRWGDGKNVGVIRNLLHSVQERLGDAHLGKETHILIGDASENADDLRAFNLSEIASSARHFETPVYVLTPETQRIVVDRIIDMTHIDRSLVQAILLDTGYAGQRLKLDAVVRGKVLTLDDDTRIPDEYGVLKEEHFPEGMSSLPNSQVLLPDEKLMDGHLNWHDNSIQSFFEFLGRTIKDIRDERGDVRVTKSHMDTMNIALKNLHTSDGRQFRVTHEDAPDIDGSDNAVVAAAWPIKYGVPDYRTVEIARAHFNEEFPKEEVSVQSCISGKSELYAHQLSHTNVDSAALSRLLTDERARVPWWFASSVDISKANPLHTVNGQYRSDNEMLPMFMEFATKAWNQLQVYVSGLETQVYHSRARAGYRPGIHEQATASLVGNIAARESVSRMEINAITGGAYLRDVEENYCVPEHLARNVFDQIKSLSDIAEMKMAELSKRKNLSTEDAERNAQHIVQYSELYSIIKAKLGDFDFAVFWKHLNVEILEQMKFFGRVLDAYPVVVDAVQDLVRKEQYPVKKFVLQNESVTFKRAGFDSSQLDSTGLQPGI